jgi:hypothetical protein
VGAVSLALCPAPPPRSAGDEDRSGFTAVLATLGLAHPTGCALHTLAGHFFVRLLRAGGAGRAWAATAWSALGAAAR